MTSNDQDILDELFDGVRHGDLAAVTRIVAKYPKSSGYISRNRDGMGNCMIHYASVLDNTDMIKFLLKHGADINSANDYGWTPLVLAAYHENIGMLKFILSTTLVDPDATTVFGLSALQCSIYRNNQLSLKLLIEHGANINRTHTNGNGMTPLMFACMSGKAALVSVLLQRGAECNAQCRLNGWTALMFAVNSRASLNIIQLLIEFGADIFVKTVTGQTALDIAQGSTQLTTYLHALYAKAMNESDSLGAPIHEKDHQGHTAFTHATLNNHIDIEKLLSSRGALIQAEESGNENDVTPTTSNHQRSDHKNSWFSKLWKKKSDEDSLDKEMKIIPKITMQTPTSSNGKVLDPALGEVTAQAMRRLSKRSSNSALDRKLMTETTEDSFDIPLEVISRDSGETVSITSSEESPHSTRFSHRRTLSTTSRSYSLSRDSVSYTETTSLSSAKFNPNDIAALKDSSQVSSLLKLLDLERYLELFDKMALKDTTELAGLEDKDLENIGIGSKRHRQMISMTAQAWKSETQKRQLELLQKEVDCMLNREYRMPKLTLETPEKGNNTQKPVYIITTSSSPTSPSLSPYSTVRSQSSVTVDKQELIRSMKKRQSTSNTTSKT